jgi:hypothetical protein
MCTNKAIKYVGKKWRSCRLNQTPHTGNTKNPPMSLIDGLISQPSLGIFHTWTPIIAAEVKKTPTPSSVDYVGKLFFYVGTIQRIYLSSNDIYSDSTLVLGLIWEEFRLKFLMFVLTLANGLCCAWYVYPILCCCRWMEIGTSCINWVQFSRSHLKTETESSFQNVR